MKHMTMRWRQFRKVVKGLMIKEKLIRRSLHNVIRDGADKTLRRRRSLFPFESVGTKSDDKIG